MGYMKAFDEAQKKRLQAGEQEPTSRAAGDVKTRESIAEKAKKRDDRRAAREEQSTNAMAGSGEKKSTDAKDYGGGNSIAGGAASGAAKGGAVGGPWGAVIGAGLGAVSASSKNKKAEAKAKKAGMSNALGTYLQLVDKGMV